MEHREFLRAWDQDKADLLFGWELDRRRLKLLMEHRELDITKNTNQEDVHPTQYLHDHPPVSSEFTGPSHDEQVRAFGGWLQSRLECIKGDQCIGADERQIVENRLAALERMKTRERFVTQVLSNGEVSEEVLLKQQARVLEAKIQRLEAEKEMADLELSTTYRFDAMPSDKAVKAQDIEEDQPRLRCRRHSVPDVELT